MSGPASMCIMFKCHILLYVELNKIYVYVYTCTVMEYNIIYELTRSVKVY